MLLVLSCRRLCAGTRKRFLGANSSPGKSVSNEKRTSVLPGTKCCPALNEPPERNAACRHLDFSSVSTRKFDHLDRIAGVRARVAEEAGLAEGIGTCIANKLTCTADAVGPGGTLNSMS